MIEVKQTTVAPVVESTPQPIEIPVEAPEPAQKGPVTPTDSSWTILSAQVGQDGRIITTLIGDSIGTVGETIGWE